jgi:hypothetical protein
MPAFDSLADIRSHLVNRFALRHAARQRRDFCPETTFVGGVDQYFESHAQIIAGHFVSGKFAPSPVRTLKSAILFSFIS